MGCPGRDFSRECSPIRGRVGRSRGVIDRRPGPSTGCRWGIDGSRSSPGRVRSRSGGRAEGGSGAGRRAGKDEADFAASRWWGGGSDGAGGLGLDLAELAEGPVEASFGGRLVLPGQGRLGRGVEEGAGGSLGAVLVDRVVIEAVPVGLEVAVSRPRSRRPGGRGRAGPPGSGIAKGRGRRAGGRSGGSRWSSNPIGPDLVVEGGQGGPGVAEGGDQGVDPLGRPAEPE